MGRGPIVHVLLPSGFKLRGPWKIASLQFSSHKAKTFRFAPLSQSPTCSRNGRISPRLFDGKMTEHPCPYGHLEFFKVASRKEKGATLLKRHRGPKIRESKPIFRIPCGACAPSISRRLALKPSDPDSTVDSRCPDLLFCAYPACQGRNRYAVVSFSSHTKRKRARKFSHK